MPDQTTSRRGLFLPLVIIVMGGFFLLANLFPNVDAWRVFSRWWPLLLVLIGLGKLWDHTRLRNDPSATPLMGISGWGVVILILACSFAFSINRHARGRDGSTGTSHTAEAIERQGNESVRAEIEMSAGELKVAGGAAKLFQGTFDSDGEEPPEVGYRVAGEQGRLSIRQRDSGPRFGDSGSRWDLRFANDVPMEMKIEMGAGENDLRIAGLALTKLDVHMGAGELNADLRGEWKRDAEVNIEGGAGSATIRLPRDVGVRVYASGGIGSINVNGLERQGGAYVNRAFGKSPVTLRVNVHGGVGEINLIAEP